MGGAHYIVDGKEYSYCKIIPAVFNINTKEITLGQELNIKTKKEFEIGKEYLHQVKHDSYKISKLISIEYKTFSIFSISGKDLLNSYKETEFEEYINWNSIQNEDVFMVKTWASTYMFEDGYETSWDMYIKNLIL